MRRRLEGPRARSAGSRRRRSAELVRIMLEADLREAGLDPDRCLTDASAAGAA